MDRVYRNNSKRLDCSFTLLVAMFFILSTDSVNSQSPPYVLDGFFIVADSNQKSVFQVELATGITRQLQVAYDPTAKPFAVTYDESRHAVFWSDYKHEQIFRYSLLNKNYSMIYEDSEHFSTFEGLAVDPVRQLLYFADSFRRQIGVMPTDGTPKPEILFHNPEIVPRAIVLDRKSRTLYWSDWSGTKSGIYRMPLNTLEVEVLINTGVVWPNCLTVDFDAGVMYWGDGSLNVMEQAQLSGSERVVLLNESDISSHFIACTHDKDYVYFTDWNEKSSEARMIRRLHRQTLVTSTLYSATSFLRANGILFVPPAIVTTTEAATMTSRHEDSTQHEDSTLLSSSPPGAVDGEDDDTGGGMEQWKLIVIIVVSVVFVVIVVIIIAAGIVCRKYRQTLKQQEEQHRIEQQMEPASVQPSLYVVDNDETAAVTVSPQYDEIRYSTVAIGPLYDEIRDTTDNLATGNDSDHYAKPNFHKPPADSRPTDYQELTFGRYDSNNNNNTGYYGRPSPPPRPPPTTRTNPDGSDTYSRRLPSRDSTTNA